MVVRRRTWWLLASGPLAWALAQAAGRGAPSVVETLYGGTTGAWVGGMLARATGWFTFSLAEFVLVAFVLFELVRLWRGAHTRPRRARAFGTAALGVARDVSVVVAVFYLVWGFHYARPRLPDREAWPTLIEDVALLDALVAEQTTLANASYRRLHAGEEDAGTPTPWTDRVALDRSLDAAWPLAVAELRLPSSAGWARGPVKPLLLSPLLHVLGLSGFYFPFTGEANLNASMPAVRSAHVMAHEKAHQRGIGPEDEANFVGWRVAALADDALANYAAAVFAQGQLLRALSRVDPELAQTHVDRTLPGIRRDLTDLRQYWDRHRGPARQVSERVNHAYLRGNRVEGGIESYGRSASLLVRFALARGGTLIARDDAHSHPNATDAP